MTDKRRSPISWDGLIFISIGFVLLGFSLLLLLFNYHEEMQAERASKLALEQLLELYPATSEKAESNVPTDTQATSDYTDRAYEEVIVPDYVINPYMEMPDKKINGHDYIGILSIPALNIELPIIGECNNTELKISPCRYSGSAYLNNMVIAGHNYSAHFGNLKSLRQGDTVSFTDNDGNVFNYKVIDLETIDGKQIEEMITGDWDLTLFTCNISGKKRITIRCELDSNV